VNQNVPKAGHLLAGNAGRSASQVQGNATLQRERSARRPLVFEDVRLTDDLEVVNHPDLHPFIRQECLPVGASLTLLP
jgi:hypothetical protein